MILSRYLKLLTIYALVTLVASATPPPERGRRPYRDDVRDYRKSRERGVPPPLGEKGVHQDGYGHVIISYGNHPERGVPGHAEHVRLHQEAFPQLNRLLPVNRLTKQEKKDLREQLIGHKVAGSGYTRDEKPLNMQATPDYHSIEARRGITTVRKVTNAESNKELQLTRDASRWAREPGASGYVYTYANIDPNLPRGKTPDLLRSVSPSSRRPKIPRKQKASTPPPPDTSSVLKSGLAWRAGRSATPGPSRQAPQASKDKGKTRAETKHQDDAYTSSSLMTHTYGTRSRSKVDPEFTHSDRSRSLLRSSDRYRDVPAQLPPTSKGKGKAVAETKHQDDSSHASSLGAYGARSRSKASKVDRHSTISDRSRSPLPSYRYHDEPGPSGQLSQASKGNGKAWAETKHQDDAYTSALLKTGASSTRSRSKASKVDRHSTVSDRSKSPLPSYRYHDEPGPSGLLPPNSRDETRAKKASRKDASTSFSRLAAARAAELRSEADYDRSQGDDYRSQTDHIRSQMDHHTSSFDRSRSPLRSSHRYGAEHSAPLESPPQTLQSGTRSARRSKANPEPALTKAINGRLAQLHAEKDYHLASAGLTASQSTYGSAALSHQHSEAYQLPRPNIRSHSPEPLYSRPVSPGTYVSRTPSTPAFNRLLESDSYRPGRMSSTTAHGNVFESDLRPSHSTITSYRPGQEQDHGPHQSASTGASYGPYGSSYASSSYSPPSQHSAYNLEDRSGRPAISQAQYSASASSYTGKTSKISTGLSATGQKSWIKKRPRKGFR